MVFGADSLGYSTPIEPLEGGEYTLEFCSLNSSHDLSDFDVVIFFDKAFETISDRGGISCSNEEGMLKRVKEVFSLLKKGGTICTLIYSIKDQYNNTSSFNSTNYGSDDTSLTKVILNDVGLNSSIRVLYSSPLRHFKIFRNEYIKYLEKYGVTKTYFNIPSSQFKSIIPICKIKETYVGAIIRNVAWDKGNIILLPCLAPDKDIKSTTELFTYLATALSESLQKISDEIPNWLKDQLIFPEEKIALTSIEQQNEIIKKLETKLIEYNQLKGCLHFTGDTLIASVSFALEKYFGIGAERAEGFIDDLKLLLPGDGGSLTCFAVAEVKGINSGVKREHINQADSHRERLKLSNNFPTLLIVNTKTDAIDMQAKNLAVATEQIKKAVTDNILIIRTLDLLNLIFLLEEKKINRDDVILIFKSKTGWLKATKDDFSILSD